MKSDFRESVDAEMELSTKCNDVILSFLFKKYNGVGVIDDLLLKANQIFLTLNQFMEKQNVTEFGYVEIIKQTDKSYKLKINDIGRDYFLENSTRYRIKSISYLKRISIYILTRIRKFWTSGFVPADKKIKTIMESGIMKLIGFLIVVFTLILKWETIIKLFK
jgi:hypothetical protein